MLAELLAELWGYVVGALAGLLLLVGLLLFYWRRRARLEEGPLLARYVLYVMDTAIGTRQRASRFLLSWLAAVLIAGLVIGLTESAQTRVWAQAVFPWLLFVHGLLALIAFVRWARRQ